MVDRKRHLAKACTYRVFGSTVTGGITYALTGHLAASVSVGLADTVLKIVLYYVHERIWYRVKWGVRDPVAAGHPRPPVVEPPSGSPFFEAATADAPPPLVVTVPRRAGAVSTPRSPV